VAGLDLGLDLKDLASASWFWPRRQPQSFGFGLNVLASFNITAVDDRSGSRADLRDLRDSRPSRCQTLCFPCATWHWNRLQKAVISFQLFSIFHVWTASSRFSNVAYKITLTLATNTSWTQLIDIRGGVRDKTPPEMFTFKILSTISACVCVIKALEFFSSEEEFGDSPKVP